MELKDNGVRSLELIAKSMAISQRPLAFKPVCNVHAFPYLAAMTALDRKHNSEKLLLSLGITLKDNLPPIEEEHMVTLRSPKEVAERILILSYLSCVATDSSLQQPVMIFMINEGLWEKTTEEEKALLHKTSFTEDDLNIIFSRTESIWMLLWVINKVEQLNLPEVEANFNDIFSHLPGFLESTTDFIEAATIRSTSEILDQSDFIFRFNWALREADARGSKTITFNEHMPTNDTFPSGG